MKVKIKRWHGIAIWKWEIDEDVCLLLMTMMDVDNDDITIIHNDNNNNTFISELLLINMNILYTMNQSRCAEFAECLSKLVVQA